MTSSLDFLSARRQLPPPGAFFAPSDLSGATLISSLTVLYGEAISSPGRFQRRNARALSRRLSVLATLFESLEASSSAVVARLPPSAVLCLREFYIFAYRVRILLDYCSQSSRLWLLLRNLQISSYFHDLAQELATLLDVLPLDDLGVTDEVREQVGLLRRQCRRCPLFVDPDDEKLRRKIQFFLSQFESGHVPDYSDLWSTLVDGLGIRDAKDCRAEIEFLEEQQYNQEEDTDLSVVSGFVALTRYCRFFLFGFEETEVERSSRKRSWRHASGEFSLIIPKDFCCPISLDLMTDPVIVSTGQTYDRSSITQWIDEGHRTCPNSGQILASGRLVPNRALRSLISRWCSATGIHYEASDCSEISAESIVASFISKAANEANKATTRILVDQLSSGSPETKTVAARELRLMAKTGKQNRSFIADAGAIPLLCGLLQSSNPDAQENAVTTILNISIQEGNKSRIMEEGCLRLLVHVLRHGLNAEARENAAATLFSLSAVHEFKKMIVDEQGAVEALTNLLIQGSSRGQKDAVMALFNLSTHPESWFPMFELGAVSALVSALKNDHVAEEAAGALALLMRHPILAQRIGSEDTAITSLVGLMRGGTPKAKENAVAALQEMCRRGGSRVTVKVATMPVLGGLIHSIFLTGTKRAKRKAAALARICQGCKSPALAAAGSEWALASTNSLSSGFIIGGDISVSVAMPIQVPAL